jgi:type I restriction enzyme, R subunit
MPERHARAEIDRLLQAAGWAVQSVDAVNLHAARGVAIREFPLNPGHGFADYLLYVDCKACGVVEAKKQGATLTGVEIQSGRYAQGLPASLPAWQRPLPFVYESTGTETHFTQGLDPAPRARNVFAFHQPDQLAKWLDLLPPLPPGERRGEGAPAAHEPAARYLPPQTFLARLQQMPELVTEWGDFKLWPAQVTAIRNLEASLAANKPGADPDGHRQRQDLHRHRLHLPPDQVRRRAATACWRPKAAATASRRTMCSPRLPPPRRWCWGAARTGASSGRMRRGGR